MINIATPNPLRRFFTLWVVMALAGLLSACASTLPTTPSGPSTSGQGVARSNNAIANEFLSLVFETENGTRIPRLLRYEGAIRVNLDPDLQAYRRDLENVLQKIRSQSEIDIALGNGASVNIYVERVSAAALRRSYPTAACVVVPGVSSFSQFLRGDFPRWSRQTRLQKAAVFIPDNAPPYIVRACLNEEIAQALGPVNDLYLVADTVFNDDNVFNSLTDYDLLILRVLYHPQLSTGMSRTQAAPLVARILRGINPAGQIAGPLGQSNLSWKRQIETAMNSRNPRAARLRSAENAVQISRRLGDHRLAHSLLIYGRLNLQNRPDLAAPAFREAYSLSQRLLGPDNLRTALAGMHMAAVALSAERFGDVITLSTPALATAQRYDDPVLAAGLLGLRALAFAQLEQNSKAQAARLASAEQARYAFGNNATQIAAAQAQIDGLLPANN